MSDDLVNDMQGMKDEGRNKTTYQWQRKKQVKRK